MQAQSESVMNNPSQSTDSPRAALMQLVNAYRLSQLVYVAAELNLADLLQEGPKHYEELGRACGADPRALSRLLRALTSAGVFTRLEGDRFELNALAENLRRDAPGSLRAWAIFTGQQLYPDWSDLLLSVKTGQNAFVQRNGMSAWEYRKQHPAFGQAFDEAMSAIIRDTAAAVVNAFDFSQFNRIVDVAGGQGVMLATILKAHPAVRGVLFDQEAVVQRAPDLLKREGIFDRCEIVGGSFFEQVPDGGELYILSHILHDWDDTESVQILKTCRRAMQHNKTLLIIERVIEPDKPMVEAALSDLNMLVRLGGRERTRAEFETLLRDAGFEFSTQIPTRSPNRIVEAKAV